MNTNYIHLPSIYTNLPSTISPPYTFYPYAQSPPNTHPTYPDPKPSTLSIPTDHLTNQSTHSSTWSPHHNNRPNHWTPISTVPSISSSLPILYESLRLPYFSHLSIYSDTLTIHSTLQYSLLFLSIVHPSILFAQCILILLYSNYQSTITVANNLSTAIVFIHPTLPSVLSINQTNIWSVHNLYSIY